MIVEALFSPLRRDATCLTKRLFGFEIANNACICSLEVVFFGKNTIFDEFQWVLKSLWVAWCVVKKKNNGTNFVFQAPIKSAKDVFHYFSIDPWLCIGKAMKSSWTSRYSQLPKAT